MYPVYEGWTANADGTFTLVFGYHNANNVAVEISPGPENSFLLERTDSATGATPAEDRGQPVRFLPGRQRSVCRLVVDKDFSGNLRWRIGFGGVAQETTERGGLDSLYLLEEIGPGYRATRDIDTATAPKGRCLNRAPTVSAGREASTRIETSLELSGFVADDGLPRGGELASSWTQVSGPSSPNFDDPKAPRTKVRFSAAGDHVLQLSASDGELESKATVTIRVMPDGSARSEQ